MKGYFRKRGKTWSFTLDIGKDAQSKRKQKTKGGFKTKKDAERACNELINQINRGEYFEPTQATLKEFLHEWLESSAKPSLRPGTLDTHQIVIGKHIIPELGNIKLTNLTPVHIQKFYSNKLAADLSAEYVRYMHSILRNSLGQAVKWQMISKNPAELVTPPKITGKEKTTWTIEEANQFLRYVAENDERFFISYLLAIHTGMRQGEILGLRWKDCDLDNNRLSVIQTLCRTSKGLIFQEPKTKGSKRVIALTDEIVATLKKYKATQNRHKLLLGTAYEDHDLLVCTLEGKPIHPRNLQRHFHRMIQQAEVPKIRFHDLRHTHASIMLQLGEHPKIVSERLGHSRTSITLDIYSHVIPNLQAEAAKKFGDAMKGKDQRKSNE
ncbi:site-specific integrase [Desmospora activa]|uniref:Site-specific recombinase XerC n=1 Tax=Desmospora activa DSM 45169 TaxID=1121389 RepID=A0A2T4ZBJ5_9BACL|nr:site-specific integrase [Desmospora activa]PTM59270.1 site-specific recombinase XerC [Desmospora activa DSM 45169]